MDQIVTPWSSVGYLTYKRTYAREVDNRTEEWPETVNRVLMACREQLDCGFSVGEENRLRDYMLGLKAMPAGRFLWQLGTSTVDRLGLMSLQNCAFVVVDQPIRPFCWTFDALMLGCGVGFNIQRKHVEQLPKVSEAFTRPTRADTKDADYIVPDSREGWVKLLGKTLKSAFYGGTFTYSTILVRGKGSPIKSFGGVASGAEDLCVGINRISEVLERRAGKKLRPIDCLDVMNIIGSVVVAGNVRRSAQIAIGDPDDVEFLLAKRWDMGSIPSWRAMSNNSVVCNDINDLHEYFWDGYEGKGEPYGLINLDLSRKVGRLGDTEYPDPDIQGYNPCAEQGLSNFETCCLSEIVLPNIKSADELSDVATLLYRIAKHSLLLHCHQHETDFAVKDKMRMGIGVTGVMQATKEQKSWLSKTYRHLRQYDKEYSAKIQCTESVKLTTVKPSGTLSLLPGVTPGCHPAYSRHLIRRIRIAAEHPLVQTCKDHGYHVEYQRHFDGREDHSTVVVSFPMSYPEHATLASEVSAIDQLNTVRWLQEHWSDNAVSCTIYYKLEELPEIRKFLKRNYKNNFKTLSFLLHSEHGFDQAPLQEITAEEYESMVANTRIIDRIDEPLAMDESSECAGGSCAIR